jgi:Centromere DNA-binding protein complex CBF3 subunit, domain 2
MCSQSFDGEPFPNMGDPSQWFPLYLFPGAKSAKQQMTPRSHRDAVKKALVKAKIDTSHVTHIFRGSALRMADLLGASESALRRGGRWDVSAMNPHYLTTLPRECMRVLAGCPASPGGYFIARNLDPAEELLKQVFPRADAW